MNPPIGISSGYTSSNLVIGTNVGNPRFVRLRSSAGRVRVPIAYTRTRSSIGQSSGILPQRLQVRILSSTQNHQTPREQWQQTEQRK